MAGPGQLAALERTMPWVVVLEASGQMPGWEADAKPALGLLAQAGVSIRAQVGHLICWLRHWRRRRVCGSGWAAGGNPGIADGGSPAWFAWHVCIGGDGGTGARHICAGAGTWFAG